MGQGTHSCLLEVGGKAEAEPRQPCTGSSESWPRTPCTFPTRGHPPAINPEPLPREFNPLQPTGQGQLLFVTSESHGLSTFHTWPRSLACPRPSWGGDTARELWWRSHIHPTLDFSTSPPHPYTRPLWGRAGATCQPRGCGPRITKPRRLGFAIAG